MKYIIFISSIILSMTGCSSKKYYEPENTFSVPNSAKTSYDGNILSINSTGATLDNGRYISKSGVSSSQIPNEYNFLNETDTQVIASNAKGSLIVVNKNDSSIARELNFPIPVVAASIKGDHIAYILNSNMFGIYNTKTEKKLIEDNSEPTYAIDTRVTNPIFMDNIVIMPMLDGKLILVGLDDVRNVRVIYVSGEKQFNNIIYLNPTSNAIIASTSTRLLKLGNKGQQEYKGSISDIIVVEDRTYIFTKDGEVIALDKDLKKVSKLKYKFAHYAAAAIIDNKVYALEQQGSLIVMNRDLTKFKVYEVDEVESPIMIVNNKLYKDGNIINLSTLGYE